MIRLASLLNAAFAGVFLVLMACAALPAAAQQTLPAQTEGVFSIGIPGAEAPPPRATDPAPSPQAPAAPAQAEVQAVWDLAAAGNWESATRLLRSLEADHAGWTAPAGLKTHLMTGRRDQQIRAALANQDWTAALALMPPARVGQCEPPFLLWSRAQAVEGLGEARGIRDFYVRVLSSCADPELVATLADRSAGVLDAESLMVLAALPALTGSEDARIVLVRGRLERSAERMMFASATSAGDAAAIRRIAGASGDAFVLEQAGWFFLEDTPSRSADYFARALERGGDSEARRGLVLATLASGDIAGARQAIRQARDPLSFIGLAAQADLADSRVLLQQGDWRRAAALAEAAATADPTMSVEAGNVIGAAYLDAASAAYERQAYGEARALALQSADYPASRRAALMRAAWSDLQLGEAARSASAFSRLYLESPDSESAEGYALAAEKSGDLDTAAALARTLGGPLGAKVAARYAEAAFNQSDYLVARSYAPEAYSKLDGVDGTWYRQSLSGRSQGGAAGENRLRGLVATTSAGTARGPNRFEAGVSVYTLDPGNSASPARPAARETFAAPYLSWSREGDIGLAARVGLLPLGTDAGAVLTGEAAMTAGSGGRVLEARAFSRPKTDSVFSFAGQEDVSGNAYGRVAETGALVRARLPVGKVHAVQADLSAASLDGENTISNAMVAAGLSASRSIDVDGFDYLATGPFYQFQSYDRNTNFFTPGHGGYFSPQSFHRAGWSLNTQTEALKDWIAKADVAVAYESVEEDPARANPFLGGGQPMIGGSSNSGMAGALDLAVARRIAPEVILSGNVSAIASEAYEDLRIGFAITWVPGGRSGLVRTDLPVDPFSPGAWVRP